jgi:hypothetical protein
MSHLFKLGDAAPAYPLSVHLRLDSVMSKSLGSVPRKMLGTLICSYLIVVSLVRLSQNKPRKDCCIMACFKTLSRHLSGRTGSNESL